LARFHLVTVSARVFYALMDLGLAIAAALIVTALTLRSGAAGNPIPGYLLALIAGVYAIYALNDDEPRNQILLAWAICASAIWSAYVGRQIKKVWG
jgi:hypothetical protein